MRKTVPVLALAALLLSSCGGAGAPDAVADGDPALSGALGDQIMVDPDLVGQNRANSAASLPSQDGALPTIDNGPEAIAAARAEALRIAGGPGRMRKAPEPREVSGSLPPGAALTAAARAAAAPGGDGDCAARAEYTTQWAARLPPAFPVYPRGAVQEAAGTDAGNCALRVVNFVTPVPLGEVMDFYFTRARSAGFSAQRVLQDGDDVLAGVKGGASYVVYARRLASGNTEVDLVTSG
ncbi:MAG TPA: hypothetical protein VEB68_06680 [Croceibacterium sp.]|nr:hypothetical protein [Croceibacterium sp.]